MTDEAKRYAEAYLDTCALGFAVSVERAPADRAARTQEDRVRWATAKAVLRDAAMQYAAALGNLDATERAELEALRRFREGVLALRGELASGERTTPEETIETIDALEAMNPAIQPAAVKPPGDIIIEDYK